MAHLQSSAMPQERDLREHGTTLSLCVKVGKAAVAVPDLDGRGEGGGWCRPDLQIRGGRVGVVSSRPSDKGGGRGWGVVSSRPSDKRGEGWGMVSSRPLDKGGRVGGGVVQTFR